MKKLILFDLDGTLIDVFDHHIRAYQEMLKNVFGVEITEREMVSHFGKPAYKVIALMLIEKGFKEEVVKEKLEEAYRVYKSYFEKNLRREDALNSVLPGVVELLETLSRSGNIIGLITGNISTVTHIILDRADLAKYFQIMVFGEVAKNKFEELERAVKMAREKEKFVGNGKDIFIIGDSKHDIEAGKKFGCVAVGVATAFATEDDLKKEKPDFVFSDLSNTERVMEIFKDRFLETNE